jgi:hypothetical protein
MGGIAANSTFSWWGLWLNKNKDAIKILPNKWLNNFDYSSDSYFKGAVIINV